MTVTFYGHSAFLCELGGFRVLFDPYITPNPLAAHLDVDAIDADFILLTHGHSDHIYDVERIAARTHATVVALAETAKYLTRQGVAKVIGANVGGRLVLPFGTVRLVAALHSNGLPDGSYGGLAVGFVVEAAEGTFYYAGDTALTQEMKTIPDLYPGGLDTAFLPIGGHYTMDVDDAPIAARWCGARHVVGMHFDTFSPIAVDHQAAHHAAAAAGITLTLPVVGARLTV